MIVTYADPEILDIARRQRAVIWLIFVSFAAVFAVKLSPFISIIVNIVSLIFVYKLAAALKMPSPWQYVVFALIPCAGVISLLVLNGHATSALKARGISVGLMGARRDDLARIEAGSEKLDPPSTGIN